jgi:hypothetical protein
MARQINEGPAQPAIERPASHKRRKRFGQQKIWRHSKRNKNGWLRYRQFELPIFGFAVRRSTLIASSWQQRSKRLPLRLDEKCEPTRR